MAWIESSGLNVIKNIAPFLLGSGQHNKCNRIFHLSREKNIVQFERVTGPVTKFKNLSGVHSILLAALENDFQLVIRKESYEIASDL